MVNVKLNKNSWWSNNIVGVIIGALIAGFFSYQVAHLNQDHQDKQVQTQINLNVAKALEKLASENASSIGMQKELGEVVKQNSNLIHDLDDRVIIIETKHNLR